MSRDKNDRREDPYRLPNRICATCGRPTSGMSSNPKAGYGDWHHLCRRDPKGHLLVVAEEQAA